MVGVEPPPRILLKGAGGVAQGVECPPLCIETKQKQNKTLLQKSFPATASNVTVRTQRPYSGKLETEKNTSEEKPPVDRDELEASSQQSNATVFTGAGL